MLSALAGLTSGCDEPALDAVCPDLAEGDLVITEIRGPQDGLNRPGQWFELKNATDRAIDLRGLELRIRKRDGSQPSSEFRGVVLIRSAATVPPGSYFVIGSGFPETMWPTTDYAAGADMEKDIPDDGGVVDLLSCGESVDRLIYDSLPTTGTLQLDGDVEPDDAANDIPANLCVDARLSEDPNNPGAPGSPGERNPACTDPGI